MDNKKKLSRKTKMKEEQHIDNSNSVLQKIATIYADRLLSDITLQVDSQKFPAHRLILCASSDVFQVMLMNPNWTESQEHCIILTEDPACIPVFPDFLKYLYTGRLNLNYDVVLPLLALADKYNVKDLMRLCIDYMLNHVVSATLSNQLISWLQYTQNSGHHLASSLCSNFMLWNFSLVSDVDEYGNLDKETLIKFLTSSELVVQDEMTLFQFVSNWLSGQEKKLKLSDAPSAQDDFANVVQDVVAYIRFPMMTPLQVANLLIHPLTRRFKEFIVERMAVAMAYHSNCLDERIKPIVEQTPLSNLLFVPRLYTAEPWCATLTIENYKEFPDYGVRTLLFSTPSSASESESDNMNEWSVDFYPKGVIFEKFYLILWQGVLPLPEYVRKCVRLSVTSKSICAGQECKVNVAVLFLAMQDGVEYVHRVLIKRSFFSHSQQLVNLDDLIPYNALNPPDSELSPYLVGTAANTLKIHIIITPIC